MKGKSDTKKFWFLGGLLTILILLYIFTSDPFGIYQQGSGSGKPVFPGFDSDNATKIILADKGKVKVFEKISGTWFIYSREIPLELSRKNKSGDFPALDKINVPSTKEKKETVKKYNADQRAVEAMLNTLKNLKEEKVISASKKRWKLFKVGQNYEVAVLVQDGSGKGLASLLIGKSSPDFVSQYFRKKGDDRVLLASSLIYQFRKSLSNWRDKQIFRFNHADIVSYRAFYPGKKLILERTENKQALGHSSPNDANDKAKKPAKRKEPYQWWIKNGRPKQAKSNKVNSIVRSLASLNARSFPEEALIEKIAQGKSHGFIEAKTKSGSIYRLELIAPLDTYDAKSKSREVVARADGNPNFFLLEESMIDRLIQEPAKLE